MVGSFTLLCGDVLLARFVDERSQKPELGQARRLPPVAGFRLVTEFPTFIEYLGYGILGTRPLSFAGGAEALSHFGQPAFGGFGREGPFRLMVR